MRDYLTLSEAAKLHEVGRGAIFAAIKCGRLKGELIDGRWRIKYEDLEEYERKLFIRENTSSYNGRKMYEKGRAYSVKQVAKDMGCTKLHIYYLLKRGELKYEKLGGQLVISQESIDQFKTTKLKSKTA